MITLTGKYNSIQISLKKPVSKSEMPWVSICSTSTGGQFNLQGSTNGIRNVIVASPATPQQSVDLVYFSITNNDTVPNTVSVYLFNNGAYTLLYSSFLNPGYSITKRSDAFINTINPSTGSQSELTVSLPAGGTVSGQTMVMLDGSGGVVAFDPTVQGNAGLLVGMSINAATIGNEVTIAVSGDVVTNLGWGLTPGGVYFATASGGISLTPSPGGISLKIGKAIDSNNLLIELYEPILIN